MSKKEIAPTKMTIAASYTLYKILTKMVYGADPEHPSEKNLAFNIKYKILRNKDLLEKDTIYFEQERARLVRELGEQTEEGLFKVKAENVPEFNKELEKILRIEVEHKLLKLTPEDLDCIDESDLTADSIALFVAAMVDDPDFNEDIQQSIPNETSSETEENQESKASN